MATGWQRDKLWSDKYMDEVKQILGLHLIKAASIEEDQQRNTDLIVLKMDGVRVGVRIRDNGYYKQYGGQFTIRAGRPSGLKTELTKIIEGWGDYFFYGHANYGGRLLAWGLGDLSAFRLWFNRSLAKMDSGEVPGVSKENKDNSSDFLAFDWHEVDGFLIASHNLPERNTP